MTKSEILNALKELETLYEAAYQAWLNDKGCASPLRFQDDLACYVAVKVLIEGVEKNFYHSKNQSLKYGARPDGKLF